MTSAVEQALLSKFRTLSAQQQTEVEDFVDFLSSRSRKQAALERLLAIAPALESAGAAPMSEDEVLAEVKAARAERRARAMTEEPGSRNPD